MKEMIALQAVPGLTEVWANSIGEIFYRNRNGDVVACTQRKTQKGYHVVDVGREPNRKTMKVHRLVAMAMVPGYQSGLEVNHLDGDKSNNAAANLEWTSHAENMRHASEVLGVTEKRYRGLRLNDGPIDLKIAFRIGPVLNHHDMHEFQGDLKEISDADLENLCTEIVDTGFAFPFNVWRDPIDQLWKLVDGHQRKRGVLKLESMGYIIPMFQTIEVLADTIEEAKRRVLQAASQYGRVTIQGLVDFAKSSQINFDELGTFRFPDIKNMSAVSEGLRSGSPNFRPGTQDEQGRLDEKKPIECPACGHSFVAS